MDKVVLLRAYYKTIIWHREELGFIVGHMARSVKRSAWVSHPCLPKVKWLQVWHK